MTVEALDKSLARTYIDSCDEGRVYPIVAKQEKILCGFPERDRVVYMLDRWWESCCGTCQRLHDVRGVAGEDYRNSVNLILARAYRLCRHWHPEIKWPRRHPVEEWYRLKTAADALQREAAECQLHTIRSWNSRQPAHRDTPAQHEAREKWRLADKAADKLTKMGDSRQLDLVLRWVAIVLAVWAAVEDPGMFGRYQCEKDS